MLLLSSLFLLFSIFQYSNANTCRPSITTASGFAAPEQICSGQLIFNENFDILNKSIWQREVTLWGGGNGEFQWYVDNDENHFVKDGKLYIRPNLTVNEIGDDKLEHGLIHLDGCTDSDQKHCSHQATPNDIVKPIRSARLRTKDSFSFKYGHVEVIAKTPTGEWLWPAIWMLPTKSVYGGWPRSGEIDLLESRGNRDLVNDENVQIGTQQVSSTLHFGPQWDQNGYKTASFSKNNNEGYNNGFHRYGLTWTTQGMRFTYDGVQVGIVSVGDGFWQRAGFHGENIWKSGTKMAPFDEEFHFILNVAVGGTNWFFPESGNNNGKKPWRNSSPSSAATDFWKGRDQWLSSWNLDKNNGESACLIIDSIKVYAI